MMVETYSLPAQKREISKNSARDTRDQARVPGVVYGKGLDPITISVDASDVLRTFRKAGKSALVDLDIDGKSSKVLLHKVELHPVRHTIYHVDFYAVNLKEKTTVTIPFNFIGESPAVKNIGAMLMKDHETIDIRCLPTEIPPSLDIDISTLENLHDNIKISDLKLDPEKFEVMHLDLETTICSAAAPRKEEEEAPVVVEGEEGEEGAEGEATEGGEEKPAEGGEEKSE